MKSLNLTIPVEEFTAFRPPQRFVTLSSLVAHYLAGADFCAKDDAVVSGGNPFRCAAATYGVWIRNEIRHGPVPRVSHPNPAREGARRAAIVGSIGPRFGVSHIDGVVGVDVDPARASELEPAFHEVAVLVEDLNAVVVAIPDEEPALGVELQRVKTRELVGAARPEARYTPLH